MTGTPARRPDGIAPPGRTETPARIVAAFDFDGTLAPGDSLLGFLRLVCGPRATAWALAAQSGPAVSTLARGRWVERDVAKAAILARLLEGRPLDSLTPLAEAYALRLIGRVRPGMRTRLQRHQEAGHEVVIVSASPEIYLSRVGHGLGVDAVLATRLEVGPDGRLTGALDGPNCRGPEKTARLRAWLAAGGEVVGRVEPAASGGAPGEGAAGEGAAGGVAAGGVAAGEVIGSRAATAYLHAYGNSAGDADLLAMADVPVWVNRRARAKGMVVWAQSRD